MRIFISDFFDSFLGVLLMDIIIRKSEYIQSVRCDGSAIVWHSLFGRPKVVTDGILEILDTLKR